MLLVGKESHSSSDVVVFYFCSCICAVRQAEAYSKLLLELGIIIGTQILYVLQKRFPVDRPDRGEKLHQI